MLGLSTVFGRPCIVYIISKYPEYQITLARQSACQLPPIMCVLIGTERGGEPGIYGDVRLPTETFCSRFTGLVIPLNSYACLCSYYIDTVGITENAPL